VQQQVTIILLPRKYQLIAASPLATGGFGGLNHPTQSSKPPNWNMKYYKSVECYRFHNVKSPCANVTSPYWGLSGDGSGCGPDGRWFQHSLCDLRRWSQPNSTF